ncbi:MAG: 3-methyladenine DNA glycosylase, partial [Rhodobacter sp.]|nr:3-methyladenine DNA glycosylase [Rhodobacter sp.]
AWFDELIQDTRIVRYGGKILSVRDNAVFLQELAAEHGSAGKAIAEWPGEDYVGLLEMLKKRGSRLGGTTGQYALRSIGVDGFILGRDVVARLIAEGVVDKAPTSKAALARTQAAFSEWHQQSGRSLKEISRVLAMSIG